MKQLGRVSTYLWLFFATLFLVSAWSVTIEVLGLSGWVTTQPGVANSVDVDYVHSTRDNVTTTNYTRTFTDQSGNKHTPSLDSLSNSVSEGDKVTLGFVGDTLATVNGTLVEGVTPVMSVVFGTSLGLLVFALFMGKQLKAGKEDARAALAVSLFLLLLSAVVGFFTIAISVMGKESRFAPWPLCMIALALGLGFFLRWRAGRRAATVTD